MNEPLRTGCPACGGTGRVSFLRSGAWLNQHCPGANGPVDVDSSPQTHELDNFFKQRKARIEYKHPDEQITRGQEFHFLAELESVQPSWWALLVLVIDEGQTSPDDVVRFKWRDSRRRPRWGEDEFVTESLDELGARIAGWLWEAAA